MRRPFKFLMFAMIIALLAFGSITDAAWASPSFDGTTPKSREVSEEIKEKCTGSVVLNTGTSKVIIRPCPPSELGLVVTATPFGNSYLDRLPLLPTGLHAVGEGVVFSANDPDGDINGTVCFPLPPIGTAVVYFLNESNDWVPMTTYQITLGPLGAQFICADGGLGTYLPVSF